ncbi:BnaC03g73520D [Brassica napus]|uniref:(rape) hypothetical protein n=1 Tax=Brassica napus TaxID=3708 RepID=A0A078IVD5_BRANA|nr:unnamed protein product [Brassica napus]CDY53921.1 BnaC03g73520D [Brassica napus]
MKHTLLSMRTEKAQMILLERNCSAFVKGGKLSVIEVASTGSHLLLPEEEIKGSSKQVHVWDVSKQHGPANDSRKRSLDHGNGDVSGASKCET